MTRRKIFAANWKMNKTLSEVESFVQDFSNYDVAGEAYDIVLFCPATGLGKLQSLAKHIPGTYGAQNMYFETSGAYTGEISPIMVKDVGCTWVLVGHSERREIFKEGNDVIQKKIRTALDNGIKPMLCVGETLEERRQNKLFDKIKTQVASALDGVSKEELKSMAIAYEPIWAIGTGETATGEQADEMCRFIRKEIAALYDNDAAENLPILYGGSVKGSNSAELMAFENIDGGLVGGASLKADSFSELITNGAKSI